VQRLLTTCASIVALLFAMSCSDKGVARRSILEVSGEITGASEKFFQIDARSGDVLLVVLQQSGLDISIELFDSKIQRSIGIYESLTGRYGEDRAQIEVEQSGPVTLKIGAARQTKIRGAFHLSVSLVAESDEADARFTQASRSDQKVRTAQRLRLLEAAERAYAENNRTHLVGLAAMAISHLLTETASDSKRAVVHGERAVASLRKTAPPLLLASALNGLAVAQGEAKQQEAMTISFTEARKIFETHGSEVGRAEVKLYDAAVRFNSEDPNVLLATFLEVAKECERLEENVCESLALMDAAVSLRNRGEYEPAFNALYRAKGLVNAKGDSWTYAQVSDNLAFLMRMVGDFDGAIAEHERAIAAFASFGECAGVSRSLYGLGYSLLGIGDNEQALRFYKLALERSCEVAPLSLSPPAGMTTSLSVLSLCEGAARGRGLDDEDKQVFTMVVWDLGNLARASMQPAVALECHTMGHDLATSAGHRLGTTLESVRDLIELGRLAEAQRLFATAEAAAADSHPWYRAQAAEVKGLLLVAQGGSLDAIEQMAIAAKAYADVGNLEGAYSALSRRATLGMGVAGPQVDRYFEDADAALESVRMLSLDPAFSASLFASGRQVYEQWIDSTLSASKSQSAAIETLVISERSRGRLLSQVAKVLQTGKEARAARLRFVAADTAALLDRVEAGRSGPVRVGDTKDPLPEVNRALGIDVARFDDEARRESLVRLKGYQRQMNPNRTVIEYLLGEKRSHAWIVRHDSVVHVDLAPAAQIRAAATGAREALTSLKQSDRSKLPLGQLHELLLSPLEQFIHGDELVIVPDDVLHEVPFAALWDEKRGHYVVQRAAVAYLPSLQFAHARTPSPVTKAGFSALLVGDPAYESDDAARRCTNKMSTITHAKSGGALRRIPGSGREVQSIHATLASRSATVTTLTGCAANRARVLASDLAGFRYVHFATHATADRVVPQRSAIYLSAFDEEGKAAVSEITAGDLLENRMRAELVILSGCATAGSKQFGGEGSLGFPFSVLAGGSRQVMSTLWPVADAASVSAMKELYVAIIERGETPTTALRSMQLQMLSVEKWKHPRNWAAYSLLGT
jgi:CHAT domain-containing protein/tetratricopeptide (TPR) repeat protein